MPKQEALNLDFTKIWPGGIDHFADAGKSSAPPKPKPQQKSED